MRASTNGRVIPPNLARAAGIRTNGPSTGNSKLNSALGRAASQKTGIRNNAIVQRSASAPKHIADPMGSVASGTTLRRTKTVQKLTQEELDEQELQAKDSWMV